MSAPKAIRSTPPTLTALLAAVCSGSIAALLCACSKPAEQAEEIRPVRTMVLSASNVDISAEYAGEVRPRIESKLGFQVGGKITSRKVDVGAVVQRGQVLMQLDPQDLRLGQAQAQASLRAAETNRDLAKAEAKRYQELRVQNFVSQAVIDAKMAAFMAAQANVDAAQAAYRGQANQAAYATLVADGDGVVTAVDAEVGQVVAAGSPVVRVARSGEKEVVIGVPEDKVEQLRQVEDVSVRLWATPGLVIPGKVREVAPMADPATRTYQFKVAIASAAADVKLGQTAQVLFAASTATPRITVPLTALNQERNVTSVWVVEQGAVRLVPVVIGGVAGNDVQLIAGVKPGQTVVTAGANLLKNGQKVRLLAETVAPAAPAAAATPRAAP
ncbi:efflux RND transporter periplasmic adaptor subunit [Massilia sp. PWRC2]|uniref:efflux RND transporter periplasmic adaptor subunit n=1 Tax=Massilia sp. PWRC2 TaxID=2804626 RepID=UPI003CF08934